MGVGDTLQQLVDDLADRLGLPVSLEDRRWRLLAHSAHAVAPDEVRLASILTREAPPEVGRWLAGLGLERRRGIVDVPAHPGLGMAARLCVPVRHGDALFGYLWVIRDTAELGPGRTAALLESAGEIALALWRTRALEDAERRREARTLHRLLAADGEDDRAAAAQALAEARGWALDGAYGVLVAPTGAGASAGELARRVGRRWCTDDSIALPEADRLVLLVRLTGTPRAGLESALRAVHGAGARVVGGGGPGHGLACAGTLLRDADAAARTLLAVPRLGSAALAEDLGSWAMLLRVRDEPASSASTPALVARLLTERHGNVLLDAAEAFLDHAGDVAATAAHLYLHRATLYRRLRRVETVTGLDLSSGDDRLVLHMSLRLWRLAGGGEVRQASQAGG